MTMPLTRKPTNVQILVMVTIVLLVIPAATLGEPSANQSPIMAPHQSDTQEGHFLYSPFYGTTTYLINETGVVNHTWQSIYTPMAESYMLDNGAILLAISSGNGGFQKIAYDNTILWEYHYSRDGSYASHDVVPLPNGDVLMIMQEIKSRSQAIQAGRDPNNLGSDFRPDYLIQVHQTGPTSGAIVWEWHLWDHLIQDYDATKDNYGIVADHPELVDINFGDTSFSSDWIHMNSVDYNPQFDQILMSAHNFDEVWIIDHGTTTQEAAGHDGGPYGHGGDLLYRWGNPASYRRGDQNSEKLYFQHQCCWIKPGLPGAGNILVFSNGNNRPGGALSSTDEFTPDVNNLTGEYYLPPGGTYGPDDLSWHYLLPANLYANVWSGAQRMLNGNTLICSGPCGTFIEVTPDQHIVWTFVNPYPSPQYNGVYRTQYLPPQHPPKPTLYVNGHLTWTTVKPGATVTGHFQIQNYGDAPSWLDWTINTTSLTWGTWTFTPTTGYHLTPQDGPITINVTCTAPLNNNKEFRGTILVRDLNNASDNGTVPIILQTPYTPPPPFPLLWHWITNLRDLLRNLREEH